MADRNEKLVIIDGFAGPGEYLGGEDGSPVIALKALFEHPARARMASRKVVYCFIEEREDRYSHLETKIDSMRPFPPNVSVYPIHGEYSQVMESMLSDVTQLAPTFLFIDPFGCTDTKFDLTGRVLGFPKCEVLVYFPTPHLVR
jgi:three-Cys-motif partner protein